MARILAEGEALVEVGVMGLRAPDGSYTENVKLYRIVSAREVSPKSGMTKGEEASCGKIRAVHSGNKKGGGKMKQQKKALSLYEDYETSVTAASDEERDELNAKFQAMEENCFDLGEDDRGTHFPKMEYSDLAKCFEKEDFAPEIKMEIARACYATYLDGYKGKAFKRHIACEL